MPDTIRCPDCGHENPAGSTSCASCNFPLVAEMARAAGAAPAPSAAEPEIIPRPLRPIRPRRPRPASGQALTLWLMAAFVAAVAVVFVAVKSNLERASQPVEGSTEDQQKRADAFRAALEKDSTDVGSRIGLADVLYDTGNWSEAIIHYRSALARDSSRATAIVDLGVCYYNLSDPKQAERLFLLALQRDPHQPQALFNLGIVSERQSKYMEALRYYHRALQSGPPEQIKQPIMEAMARVQKAAGIEAPPLPQTP